MTISVSKIYFYAVALITLIILIFAVYGLIQSIVDYFFEPGYLAEQYLGPEIKNRIAYEVYGARTEKEAEEIAKKLTPEEIKKYREELKEKSLKAHKKDALKRLVMNILWILVIFPIYLLHFRQARRVEA